MKERYYFFMSLWIFLFFLFLIAVFPSFWYEMFRGIPFIRRLTESEGESKPFGWFDAIVYSIIFYTVLLLLSYKNAKVSRTLTKNVTIFWGFLGMLLSRDFVWKSVPAPEKIRTMREKKMRRIVFVRHGESEWNEIFNRGFNFNFFVKLIKGFIKEFNLLSTRDSVFVDASLSPEGMEQIEQLNEFLSHPPPHPPSHHHNNKHQLINNLIEILRGSRDVDNSIIVCSNLRRAIATAAIGFQHRLKKTGEQIYLMSSLQEISYNVDANAISGTQEVPDLHVIDSKMFDGFDYSYFNASNNFGQKPLFRTNGFKRMREFCEWAFSQPKETIIVGGGHSFYFRAFFQSFLDSEKDHKAKTNIMKNGGVVTFVLETGRVEGIDHYRIPPESILEIFGGKLGDYSAFKESKKKKKN